MTVREYRHLSSATLLVSEEVTSAEALALASMPGGCEGSRYPLFVEIDKAIVKGGYARIEFILPGKPGRWLAAGEVTGVIPEARTGLPKGVCLELVGLTLTRDHAVVDSTVGAQPEPGAPLAFVPVVAFDPSGIGMEEDDVCGMLADLMGREVDATTECTLPGKLKDNAIVAVFRDDQGGAAFAVTFDKAGAARVGGALTMLPEAAMSSEAKSKGMLSGEPLENVSEVLNIMSALFHEAGTPHVVLAEVLNGVDMRSLNDGELVALFDEPRWSLAHGFEIEDYGKGEVYISAR